MPEAIEQFLLYLATERGLSTNYQISTRASLERFFSWLTISYPDQQATTEGQATARATTEDVIAIEQISPEHLQNFLIAEKSRGLAVTSLKLEIIALRIFFRFLCARGLLATDPAQKLPLPRLPQSLPEPLMSHDMEKLLHAPAGNSPLELRDRALLELLYACGLRISELCNARLENIDLQEGLIRVTGKGNKTRLIPIGHCATDAIKEYLSNARPKLLSPKSGAAIFLSVRGHPLTPARIWQLVLLYSKRAGLQKPAHPHQLRHSFATDLLAGGADLRVIQELLGHACISTTQIYTQVDRTQLKKAHKNFHPRG
ncbi:MAG: tyrosine recombinase [Chthoniobacterales bacterium]